LLDNSIMQKVSENSTRAVSTFFLFYQLYNHREFSKYKDAFLSLSKESKKTKYYAMIHKQY